MQNYKNINPLECPLYETLDEAIILSQEIAQLRELESYEIFMLFGDRISELAVKLERFSEDQILVFSGIGYAAMTDYFGNIVTVHKSLAYSKGKLIGLELKDKHDFEFYDTSNNNNEDDDDEGDEIHDLMTEDGLGALIKDWESELLDPPENYRLYGRFLMNHQTGIEYPIAGSAVITDTIITNQFIDLSTIELHHVDVESEKEYFETWMVPEALDQLSAFYRLSLKYKDFRKASARKQQLYLEPMIETMNSTLGMERFSVVLPGGTVNTPRIEDGELHYEQYELEDDLIGSCLKVDCLELQLIRDGQPMRKRRGNINANASLCIVAEIEQEQADFHGIDSTIVWIPILNQIDNMELPIDSPI